MTKIKNPRIWYLPGPYFRYVEDVKELAQRHGLRIIDSNVTESRGFAVEGPAVTLKPEYGGPALTPTLQEAVATVGAVALGEAMASSATPLTLEQALARVAELEGAAAVTAPTLAPKPAKAAPVKAKPTPDAAGLFGSDKLPAMVEIGSGAADVQLGAIVAAAHAASEMSVDEWNALTAKKRDGLLAKHVELLRNEAAAALAKTLT